SFNANARINNRNISFINGVPHFIEGAFTLFDTDKYGNAYYRFIEDGKIQQELVVSSEGYFLSFGETAYAIEGGPLGYYPVENSVQFGISNQSSSLGSAPNLQSAFSS